MLKNLMLLNLAITIFVVVVWVVNVVKFTGCDFEAPYKCEAVHGVGILGPAAVVTVWFEFDEK